MRVDLVAEELDPDRELLVHRDDLDRVAAHPERAAGEGEVVAGVLHPTNWRSSWSRSMLVADPQRDHPVDVLLRRAQAVDARHRGDHDDVAPGQQRVGGRVPQPLDLLVDRRVLLDVGVGLRRCTPRAGSSRSTRRSTRRRCSAAARGTRWPAGRRASCSGAITSVGPLHLLDQPGRGRRLAGAGGAEQHDVLLARARCAGSGRRSPSAGRRDGE